MPRYLAAIVLQTAEWLFRDPADLGCVRCPENLLLVAVNSGAANAVIVLVDVAAIAIAVAIADILARRWRAATGPARRVLAPVLWTSVIAALLFASGRWPKRRMDRWIRRDRSGGRRSRA